MDHETPITLPFPEAPPRTHNYNFQPGKEGGPGRPVGVENHKTHITHDAIIDFMIANPRATRMELAHAFGYKSPVSISVIMNSDSFLARYEKRRTDICDPIVSATVEDRLRGIAHRSAEIVAERLESAPLDHKFALEAMRASVGAVVQKQGPQVNVGFVVHLPGPASSSEEWARKFAPESGEVLLPRTADLPSEK